MKILPWLKIWCDPQGFNANVKYAGGDQLAMRQVIVTSNFTISQCFKPGIQGIEQIKHAVQSRFSQINIQTILSQLKIQLKPLDELNYLKRIGNVDYYKTFRRIDKQPLTQDYFHNNEYNSNDGTRKEDLRIKRYNPKMETSTILEESSDIDPSDGETITSQNCQSETEDDIQLAQEMPISEQTYGRTTRTNSIADDSESRNDTEPDPEYTMANYTSNQPPIIITEDNERSGTRNTIHMPTRQWEHITNNSKRYKFCHEYIYITNNGIIYKYDAAFNEIMQFKEQIP